MAEKYGFTADSKSQKREQRNAERERKKGERLEKARNRNTFHSQNVRTFDVVSILLTLMFTILLVSVLTDTNREISLVGVLDYLESMPTIDFSMFKLITNFEVTANWGVFNFARDIWNLMLGVTQFLATLAGILWNALFYFFGFLRWVFIG